MTWSPYELDRRALKIVLNAQKRDRHDSQDREDRPKEQRKKESSKNEGTLGSLSQVYKMRASCAYGLERFWGEHLRLAHALEPTNQNQTKKQEKDKKKLIDDMKKARIIVETWLELVDIMKAAGIHLPKTVADLSKCNDSQPKALTVDEIEAFSFQIWNLDPRDAQVSLSVLTAFCDSIVWWTQRLKSGSGDQEDGA